MKGQSIEKIIKDQFPRIKEGEKNSDQKGSRNHRVPNMRDVEKEKATVRQIIGHLKNIKQIGSSKAFQKEQVINYKGTKTLSNEGLKNLHF